LPGEMSGRATVRRRTRCGAAGDSAFCRPCSGADRVSSTKIMRAGRADARPAPHRAQLRCGATGAHMRYKSAAAQVRHRPSYVRRTTASNGRCTTPSHVWHGNPAGMRHTRGAQRRCFERCSTQGQGGRDQDQGGSDGSRDLEHGSSPRVARWHRCRIIPGSRPRRLNNAQAANARPDDFVPRPGRTGILSRR